MEEEKVVKNVDEEEIDKEIAETEHASEDYTGDNIQVLEGLEAVRKRPGMYIGTTSSTGLHHLVWEIVDNSIDEALAGYCKRIIVTINPDNSVTVKDDGRGIPVDVVKKTGVSAVETVYTVLHAGGKFGEGGGYKISGGLHGVGASVVNALSTWLEVEVHKEGGAYFMRFENGGHVKEHLKRIGDADDTGTIVTFKPDDTIFTETTVYDYEVICTRLQQMAFLNRGIEIVAIDARTEENETKTYKYDGGIKEYVTFLTQGKTPIFNDVIYCGGIDSGIAVEVALQYNEGYASNVYSYCNNINTHEGGTHEEGFRLALTRVINNYARSTKMLKDNDDNLTSDDVREGIVAIISVKHPNPQYEGQTKTKLGNSEVRKIVSSIMGEQLERYLQENPKVAKVIVEKAQLAGNARIAAKNARDTARRKSALELTSLPGKLADCSSKDPSICELFIVEGNSAGGSAKNGRNRETQAILPLRGKILNVEKAQQKRIFANAEIGNMIIAIGGGYGSEFDVSKIRYHKIVIMTDADVDGSHIQILLLTFFYRFMKPLIEQGYVYIARSPLYRVNYRQKFYYAFNDDQLEMIKSKLPANARPEIQRYKGLGEMDDSQLWETTMDPERRKMYRVTLDDAIEADRTFDMLMGDDVEPRKEFIKKHAKFVKNLDI